jgi:hypothetical protein
MKVLTVLSVGALLVLAAPATAACYCACINNAKIKVCENSWDANYVYCSGTYCTGSLDLPPQRPGQEEVKERFAALFNNTVLPSSKFASEND